MNPVLETHNLTKKYPVIRRYREMFLHPWQREEIIALRDVTLSVERGEIFGILGLNGAGKTTLLKIFATLILPNSGQALVNGFDVVRQEGEVRRSIGFVVNEERSFYWRLTGWQNLSFFGVLDDIPPRVLDKRIVGILDLVGLQKDAHRMVKDYSTGMKQRLAIARGLLTNPDILILDEPTRALDPVAAGNLREFISTVLVGKEGKTVCLATHNLAEAETLCTRIAVLHNGRIRACAEPAGIRKIIGRRQIIEIQLSSPAPGVRETIERFCEHHGLVLHRYEQAGGQITLTVSPGDVLNDISEIVGLFRNMNLAVRACRLSGETTMEGAFRELVREGSS